MRIAAIKTCDINNGPGLRVTLWVQGCMFRCKGCHNKETWDLNGGKNFTHRDIMKMEEEILKGQNLSILGGEPLLNMEYIDKLTHVLNYFKCIKPDLNVWLWTGHQFEDVKDYKIMEYIDVIVDGRFNEGLKDEHLYHGSSNQRVIDVQKSLKENMVILYNEK